MQTTHAEINVILNTIYLYNLLTCKSTNIAIQPNYIRNDNNQLAPSIYKDFRRE